MYMPLCSDLRIQPIVVSSFTSICGPENGCKPQIKGCGGAGNGAPAIHGRGGGQGWSAALRPHPSEEEQPGRVTGWRQSGLMAVRALGRRLREGLGSLPRAPGPAGAGARLCCPHPGSFLAPETQGQAQEFMILGVECVMDP